MLSVYRKADESDLRSWLRRSWFGWIEFYEPGIGGGTGYPDVQLLLPESLRLLPIELKIGTIKNGRVYSERIRPAQIGWHARYSHAGGSALFCVGVYNSQIKDFLVLLVDGLSAADWRKGFAITRARPMLASVAFEKFVLREFDR